MAESQIVIEVRLRWWFKWLFFPLLCLTLFLCRLFDPTVCPRQDWLDKWFERGVVFLLDGEKINIKTTEGEGDV